MSRGTASIRDGNDIHTHTQKERERETTSKLLYNVSLGLRPSLVAMLSQLNDQPFGITLSLPQ
jgi:hypothetical protein